MNIDIMTLFPDSVNAMMHVSILGRAIERGYIQIRSHQIRDYTTNKQMRWMTIPTAVDEALSCRPILCIAAGLTS